MSKKLTELKKISDEIEELAKEDAPKVSDLKWDIVLSTGSTLLDLGISGNIIRGGGIPSGAFVEIYGPNSSGKTCVLVETATSCQNQGGEAKFLDPEARLNKQYAKEYGLELEAKNYETPDTVKEFFSEIWDWEPSKESTFNMIAADSLAALSTEMEMEDEDKMGMKRAKDFSEGFRKTCRLISNSNMLVMCSNQEREGKGGSVQTTGGKAGPYYAHLRIRIKPAYPSNKIKRTRTVKGVPNEKIIGVYSVCEIQKSILDDPFRKAPIYIVFGYGIDDIRANLIYLKEKQKHKKFIIGKEEFGAGNIDKAITYVENNNLQKDIREQVIDLWEEIENAFKIDRKPKKR